jgi:hypothetical protein
MPTMQGSISIAANAVSTNQLAGLLYEFLDAPARITLSVTGSATGLNVTFLVAGVALINDSAINLQNRFPVIPDDIVTQEDVPGGRMILTGRNTTAGALTLFWRTDVDFL